MQKERFLTDFYEFRIRKGRRFLSTMGCFCGCRSYSPFNHTRIISLQEQMGGFIQRSKILIFCHWGMDLISSRPLSTLQRLQTRSMRRTTRAYLFLQAQTMASWHRVHIQHGGNGKALGGGLLTIQKVEEEVIQAKSGRSDPQLAVFGKNLRKRLSRIQFILSQMDPLSRCQKCATIGYRKESAHMNTDTWVQFSYLLVRFLWSWFTHCIACFKGVAHVISSTRVMTVSLRFWIESSILHLPIHLLSLVLPFPFLQLLWGTWQVCALSWRLLYFLTGCAQRLRLHGDFRRVLHRVPDQPTVLQARVLRGRGVRWHHVRGDDSRSEKACLSVSHRRPCPSERGDLLDQLFRS